MSTVRSPVPAEAQPLASPRLRTLPARPTVLTRLRVAIHRDALDTALAAGADPSRQLELAIRAAQLERPRHRRALAKTLRRCVVESRAPLPPVRATPVVIARKQIREQADDVLALAARLDRAEPAQVKGIAIAQRLVTDALESPLYKASDAGSIARLTREAAVSMDDPAAVLSGGSRLPRRAA